MEWMFTGTAILAAFLAGWAAGVERGWAKMQAVRMCASEPEAEKTVLQPTARKNTPDMAAQLEEQRLDALWENIENYGTDKPQRDVPERKGGRV